MEKLSAFNIAHMMTTVSKLVLHTTLFAATLKENERKCETESITQYRHGRRGTQMLHMQNCGWRTSQIKDDDNTIIARM
jgi:hypothetical protein